jgi:segregation and condensation protein B
MNDQTNPIEEEKPGTEPDFATPGTDPDVVEQRGEGEDPAHESGSVPIDLTHVKRVLEAALLSTTEPLTVQQLRRLFGGQVQSDNIRKVLDELKDEWSERSIELTAVASGWRFRVKPMYQEFLDRISNEKPPRYSRAVLETLAIIAYRQPVTRGDIEEIRGVAVSPATLKALEERGWIEAVGHRETPGRPALFATTRKFLDDLNLRSLEELPPLDELQSALEPAPTLLPVDAAPEPQQDSLIEEATPPTDSTEPQEPETHAG